MPDIPFSSAPRVGSPKLMTGKLIPVNSPESNSGQPIQRTDIDLVGVGGRKLTGSDLFKSQSPEVSASDLQNDPKRSWVNLWSPKQVIPTTPKTMDNPPPEPPLPHTRRNSFSDPYPRLTGNYKPKNQMDETGENDDSGLFGSFGEKLNDLYKHAGEAWNNATPMEKGLAIGIPTALAAGAGALYLRKKRREANKSSSR